MTKVYIYDQRKAGFYMYNGIFPLEVGISDSTKKRYYVFTKEKTKHVYEQWMNEIMKKGKYYERNKDYDSKQTNTQYKR